MHISSCLALVWLSWHFGFVGRGLAVMFQSLCVCVRERVGMCVCVFEGGGCSIRRKSHQRPRGLVCVC